MNMNQFLLCNHKAEILKLKNLPTAATPATCYVASVAHSPGKVSRVVTDIITFHVNDIPNPKTSFNCHESFEMTLEFFLKVGFHPGKQACRIRCLRAL